MDVQTIHAYNSTAAARCERYRLILPTELLLFAPGFFHRGQPTADIGCGSGRDVAWLNEHGFPSIGYDASPAMLAEARTAYPGIDVRAAALPELAGVPDGAYANVLCSVVLMHLPQKDLSRAVRSLARIIQPGGRLLLSYRSSAAATEREADGRLFTAIPPAELMLHLDATTLRVLEERQQTDAYRPSVHWFIFLAEKQLFLGAASEDAVHSDPSQR